MTRLTYNVVRRPGGWAVEYDQTVIGRYRRLEEAVARARQLGRDGWEDGQPSLVQVETIHGSIRTEIIYDLEQHPG